MLGVWDFRGARLSFPEHCIPVLMTPQGWFHWTVWGATVSWALHLCCKAAPRMRTDLRTYPAVNPPSLREVTHNTYLITVNRDPFSFKNLDIQVLRKELNLDKHDLTRSNPHTIPFLSPRHRRFSSCSSAVQLMYMTTGQQNKIQEPDHQTISVRPLLALVGDPKRSASFSDWSQGYKY